MPKIFPPSPELDWLKEHIAICYEGDDSQLWEIYQFLLWFGRMRKAKPNSQEYLVAYGYTLWFRQAVYREQLTDAERESVKWAEIGYAELKGKKRGK